MFPWITSGSLIPKKIAAWRVKFGSQMGKRVGVCVSAVDCIPSLEIPQFHSFQHEQGLIDSLQRIDKPTCSLDEEEAIDRLLCLESRTLIFFRDFQPVFLPALLLLPFQCLQVQPVL